MIGEDTDLLVLLLHHKASSSQPVFLTCEEKSNMKCKPKIWDIAYAQNKLGDELCEALLDIHAMLGCDTTSRVRTVGKVVILNKFKSNIECRRLLKMLSSSQSRQDILAAGEVLLLMVMGGTARQKMLDELRYSKYNRKLGTSKKALSAEMLGPTSDAACQHILRVYHQVQVWKGKNDLVLNEWGWKVTNDLVLPVAMTKPPRPANLLKVIR